MDRRQACAFWLKPDPPAPTDGPAGATKARLRAAYQAPQRRYHGLQHIADCLQDLAAVPGLADEPRLRLAYAVS